MLSKIGCPDKYVNIIRSFHDGMLAHVIGCRQRHFWNQTRMRLSTFFFSIFFSLLLGVAFRTCITGIPLVYRTDCNFFDLRKVQAKNLVHHTTVRELLFADDCALAAHTVQEAQYLLDCFVTATRRFGLSVSIKNSKVMFQPHVSSCYLPPVATNNSIQLPFAETFCYLGSRVTYRNTLDDELTARVAKAEAAFGQLSKWLWNDHGVHLDTKIQVYRAAILSSLLYGSETWTPYRRHIKKLDNFHMKCLRRILDVQWQDRIPTQKSLTDVRLLASKSRSCNHSYIGAVMSIECRTAAYPSSYCTDNSQTVLDVNESGTKIIFV